MEQPSFKSLLEQYVADSISGPGKQALFEMLRSPEHQQELEQILDEGFREQTISGLSDPGRADLLFNRILEEVQPPAKRRRMFRWLPYAAAAVVLILAGLLLRNDRKAVLPSTVSQQDVAPGSHKAMLTLADGTVMTLDSAGSLQLQQGGAIIRQQHGQISYVIDEKLAGISYNILTTPRGGQFSIVLPDGSRVWLNSASSLRYPVAFTEHERKVELQGQAYFEIAPNAAQPFRVLTAKGMEVTVLGTHFDIMAYPDEADIRTTLFKGAVRVTKGNGSSLLKPGQQAVLDAEDRLSVHEADLRQVMAWKTGFFEFTGTSLTAIMRQLQRWYDVEVEYQAQYPGETFWGRIGRDLPLSQVLHLLEENGVRFRIEGKKLIVLPKENSQ